MRSFLLALVGLIVCGTTSVQAQAALVAGENAWIMTPPPGATEASAYLTIRASADDRLLSVSCACAARAQLHEMHMDGAVMRMRPLPYGVSIAAGSVLSMSPHGTHIMLLGLAAPLNLGQAVPLRLTFRDAGVVEIVAEVRRPWTPWPTQLHLSTIACTWAEKSMAHVIGRRSLMLGAAIAAAPVGGEAAAQDWWPFRRRDGAQNVPAQHEGHGAHAAVAPVSREEAAVVAALGACEAVGEACLTHCLALLGAGDASMAACARGVRDMLAVCRATQTLVQGQSALAGAQLALCRDACSACAAACAPHTSHHAPCSDCADQCRSAIAAIDALMT